MAGLDSYVKLYCNFNGTDGSTTILDNYGGKTLTASNDAQLDTAQKKFGSASLLFDGVNDYVTVDSSGSDTDFDFGSGDFTIDCQIRVNSFPSTYGAILAKRTSGSTGIAYGLYIKNTGELYFEYSQNGTTLESMIASIPSFATSTWYHVAVCRNGEYISLYADGVHLITKYIGDITLYTSSADVVMGATETTNNDFNGWIDELRFSKGIARYDNKFFTPPTSALSADANDVILLHMDGTDESTTFTDSSLTGRSVTANGGAKLKTSASPDSIIPIMTSNTAPSGEVSASSQLSSYAPWYAVDNSPASTFWASNVNPSWWAYEFTSSKTIVYYSIQARATFHAQAPYNWTFEGWTGSAWDVLDTQTNVAFTSGEVKEFTFSNTTAYIKYRLNITDNNASGGDANYTTFTNVKMAESTTGATPKIGSAMGLFESNGYLSMADSSDFDLNSSDFSFETYFYPTALGVAPSFYDQRDSAVGTIGLAIEYQTSGEYMLAKYTTASGIKTATATIALSINRWYHLAVQRTGQNVYIYIDGYMIGKTDVGSDATSNSTGSPLVGYSLFNYFDGFLDELRLSIGATRYATSLSFTPPSEEYSSPVIAPPSTPSTTATILICDYQATASAETGTVEASITLAGHGLSADDFIVNTTQNNTSRRILSTTTDTMTVVSVSGQTQSDIIRTYQFIDHTDKLKDSTLRVNKKIQEDTEASFTLICPPTYIPRAGQYVKINTNGQHVFTGFLRSVKRRLPQNGIDTKIFCDCECITLNAIPPRRTVAIAYNLDTTAGSIVSSLVNSFLVDEGVASGTIEDGAVLSEDWYDDALSIADIFDALAEQSGFQWMIDKDFNLQFYQDPATISTYSATISDLTTSTFNEFRNVTINETIDNYNNKAFFTGNTDDYGNIIIVSQETTASILEMQDYSAGTGVYGTVVRDSNFTQHQFFTATAGTTESTISATNIGLSVDVGDMVYNIDGYERRNVLAKTTDTLTVDAVSGQTEGQVIATYQQINDLVDNHLKRQDQIPRRLEFDSFQTDFEAGQKLQVVLSKLSVTTTETYVIDEVDIQDRGANYFVAHVVADKRNADNFSTQRTPNYKDYYRQL